jgi:hypothetical protein
MANHKQVFVRVNARVDAGMAGVVTALNEIRGLQTVESCEGEVGGKAAYVYFWFGDWQQLSKLCFLEIAPRLAGRAGADCKVSVEVLDESRPTGKIEFSAEAAEQVVEALRQLAAPDRGIVHPNDASHAMPEA